MIEIIKQLLDKEKEYQTKIKELEIKNIQLEQKINVIKDEVLTLRLYGDKNQYCSLEDFCRITKNIYYIKAQQLKQWLYQQDILDRYNDKYIPNKNSNICILYNSELYIKYEYIRKNILLLRDFIYTSNKDEVLDLLGQFFNQQDILTEEIGNTVYVAYKQNSNEFRKCKGNKFSISNTETNQIGE